MNFFFILLILAVATVLYGIKIFNSLVTLKNNYLNAFSQIQVQLKRQYELIPNLVKSVKAYMKHEQETLERITLARSGAMKSLEKANPNDENSIKELSHVNTELSNAMNKLNITLENYPELKANENMLQLQEELTTTQNKIAFARQAYNDAVTEYNSYKQSFPALYIAEKFNHRQDASLLEFEDIKEIEKHLDIDF
ncbi:MAG: LemA family protein [Campylobacteraceae bacterium]|nr:LemA family protein [Campylobacteraceae bacterium]